MKMDHAQSAPLPPAESSKRSLRISEDGIVYASIVALALGVIPIVALSDRLSLRGADLARMVFCGTLLATAGAAYLLARAGLRRQAALLLVVVLWSAVTAFAFVTGIGLHSAVMFLYIVAILYASLLCGFAIAVAQTALTIAALTAFYWAEMNGRIGGIQAFLAKTTNFNFYLGIVVSSIGALVIAAAYQRAVEHAAREAREANDKLESLNAGLERAVAERTHELQATIQELESFNYSVAHDLRTPLRAIHGHATRVRADLEASLTADSRRHLERVAAEAQRMDMLLMALLGFGRIGRRPLRIAELDLSDIATQVAHEISRGSDGARVQFRIQPALTARGDRHLVRTLLEHLIGNAVKFSRGRDAPTVEFARESSDRGPAFLVRDNGVGFDPEFSAHLYRPFHRLHGEQEFSGLGMGLASVRRIVERHGGQVWADSSVHQGATFFFTLPDPAERSG